MPSGSYRQVYVKCPFYLYDDGARRICCEGIAPETTVATMFHHRSQMQQHMRIFCEDAFTCCELYRAVMAAKYEDEDEEGDQ